MDFHPRIQIINIAEGIVSVLPFCLVLQVAKTRQNIKRALQQHFTWQKDITQLTVCSNSITAEI